MIKMPTSKKCKLKQKLLRQIRLNNHDCYDCGVTLSKNNVKIVCKYCGLKRKKRDKKYLKLLKLK